ncbi:MAG: hypothetical protein NZ902_06720, partial [Acidilobaceae archaeon]|nr:hypothetical protein [Acidilobaceae archaeon]MDW7974910.1 hypothetical protein [Sulfolobales archaeon]
MPDPTLMDVIRRVESRIRRLRPLDDFEELAEVILGSYRDCLRAWPWGFALQRYRTRLLRPNSVTVELTQGSRALNVVSSGDPIDWSLWPLLSIPGRRPLYTDGGGVLVDAWLGETGTYQGRLIYSVIPLFDVQVWGLAVTNVGPLAKMSFQMLETLSPNRDKVGRPKAFVPYTPYVEVYPGPDSDYDVDVWITPLPDY